MAVITPQVVSAHANGLLSLIDNADGTLEVCGQGRVEMDGLDAAIYLTDGDCVYSLTLHPIVGTAADGVAVQTVPDRPAK